jgi:hypothetical protein
VDDTTWAKYLDLHLQFSHLNLEEKIHIQGGWNVMTRISGRKIKVEDNKSEG